MTIAKAYVAALAAVLATVVPQLTGVPLGLAGWANVVALIAGAVQVYNAGNIPGWRYAKTIAAVVSAVGVVAVSTLADGVVSTPDLIQMAVAAVGAFGVWLVPNQSVIPA